MMTTTLLSYKTKQAIDDWLKKFPADQKQSGVLFALRAVQAEQGGTLSVAYMDAVAAYLDMPKIAVYEVASFYDHFNLKPAGRHTIGICTNISCLLRDAEDMVMHLKNRLKIECGETTEDGRFTLKAVECLAACGGAPVMHIDEQYYENLNTQTIDAILEGFD